jgi:type II secretory pathway component PulF
MGYIPVVVVMAFITGLALNGMKRLRGNLLLRLLATVSMRGVSIEKALQAASGQRQTGTLANRLLILLRQGTPLSSALQTAGIIGAHEEVALRIAGTYGIIDRLLTVLVVSRQRADARFRRMLPIGLYPVLLGVILGGLLFFIGRLICPFLGKMISTLTSSQQISPGREFILSVPDMSFLVGGTLVLWGVVLISLQAEFFYYRFWRRVPGLGTHFELWRQARLAGRLSLLLGAGATLESALASMADLSRKEPVSPALAPVLERLRHGVAPRAAFSSAGSWRPEFLWALDAVSQGAPPTTTFQTVATVMEEKGDARLRAISRYGMPVAVLVAGLGVGSLAYMVFDAFRIIQEALL